ncbi:hypothetical protein APS67_001764 [Streptomyces sp. AVP053U2]|nr:hypothetical protein APS67_001764 [Streptomyces sp. AVP053U2]
MGHAHIGVTAGVYAHVRLRLQRQAIDTLNHALGLTDDDPDDPPATAAVVGSVNQTALFRSRW